MNNSDKVLQYVERGQMLFWSKRKVSVYQSIIAIYNDDSNISELQKQMLF